LSNKKEIKMFDLLSEGVSEKEKENEKTILIFRNGMS
jgi:hypothetical protein